MRVEVFEEANVVAKPGCHVVYQPGIHVAPRAHIEQIEAQGKGKRVETPADSADVDQAQQGETE
jgi:hypothetical protein